MKTITGRVFFLGDQVDTDQILPGYAMSLPVDELKNFVLQGSSAAGFAQKVRPGDVIVAGSNFGCGSSREQAPVALKESGVGAIIASSLAMIFRKNCINIGLPVLTSPCIDQIIKVVQEGDQVELDIESGFLLHIDSSQKLPLNQLSDPALATLRAGGLINRVRNTLIERGKLNDFSQA